VEEEGQGNFIMWLQPDCQMSSHLLSTAKWCTRSILHPMC